MPNVGANAYLQTTDLRGRGVSSGQFCQLCGAWFGCLGLEPSPELYVKHIVDIFREVRRVLRDDGTVFLNIGDSYWGGKGKSGYELPHEAEKRLAHGETLQHGHQVPGYMDMRPSDGKHPTLKPKDLCLIPERLAIALQQDGWWIRVRIPWIKLNSMPSSQGDRPTVSHEYIFLMSKARKYYYDQEAVKVPNSAATLKRFADGQMPRKRMSSRYQIDGAPGNYRRQQDDKECVKNGRIRRTTDWWFDSLSELFSDEFMAFALPTEPFTMEMCQQCKQVYTRSEYNKLGVLIIPADKSETGKEQKKRICAGCGSTEDWLSHFACVDEETECLTASGWKRYNSLSEGEIVAGYDLEDGLAKWTELLSISTYSVRNQRMVSVQGRTLDMVLTPNHRCVITRRNNRTLEWANPSIVEADALKKNHKIIVAPDWEEYPKCQHHRDIIALVGWYVTEGGTGTDTITIHQSKTANPEYCDEIRKLLRNVGADFSEYIYHGKWRGREATSVTWRIKGAVATELMALCPDKHLPENFLLWDSESLKILWDSLMKGDGNFRSGGRNTFVQKNKTLIDQVQALATRLCFPTTLTKRSTLTWSLYKTEARDRLLRSETGSLFGEMQYSGVVWCPQTKFGTFIARRNGKVFVTGNTFGEKLVRPMVLAGTSPQACPHCGAGWKRVVEKESHPTRPGVSSKYGASDSDIRGSAARSRLVTSSTTLGWQPTCSCENNDGSGRATVFDPFSGSGTTCVVAKKLGRSYVGIEQNDDYVRLCDRRLEETEIEIEEERKQLELLFC